MFDFDAWIDRFKAAPGFNDAGVTITGADHPNWRVLGVHRLYPEEVDRESMIFVEVLCKQGDRDRQRAVHWDWLGRNSFDPPPHFTVDKPDHELKDLFIHQGMNISLWIQGGEMVSGLVGPDSYFVCFQEVGDFPPPVQPQPPDNPPPNPVPPPPGNTIETVSGDITVTISGLKIRRTWFNAQEVDENGYVTIDLTIKTK